MEIINVSKKKERKHLFYILKEGDSWISVPNFPIGPTPIFSLGTCFSFFPHLFRDSLFGGCLTKPSLIWWNPGCKKSSTINNSYIKLPSMKVEKCLIYSGRKHFSIFKNCRAELFLGVQM